MQYNLVTVVWGEEHTDLFVNLCIPNLLTTGNISVLHNTPNPVFRIFTMPKDALTIEASPTFKEVSKIVDVQFAMMNDKDFTQKYTLASRYFKKAIDLAANDNAAAIVIGPESIRSEGYIANLLRIAESGKKVIMISQIRVAKETFLPQLVNGFFANGVLGDIAPRELVALALEHLHPVSKSLLWDSKRFHNAPGHIYFEVPNEGILSRCFHLSPVLVKGASKDVGFSTALDGDYILNACPDIDDIYIASDSDELMSVEVSSLSHPGNAGRGPSSPLNIAAFAKYFTCSHNRVFIRHKIRFHIDDISPQWEEVERFSDKAVDRIFYWLKFEPLLFWPYGVSLKIRMFARRIIRFFLGESATRRLAERMRSAHRKTTSFIKGFLQRIEFNRAVFFGIMGKTCSVITGPITALLIAVKFTPHLQGFYYTFLNLLALQTFVELGLGTVIIQFASHEWSRLAMDKDGYIRGETDALSRLSSLGRFTSKWCIVSGCIAAIGLGIGGYFFFASSVHGDIAWSLPWIALCVVTGINIFFAPIWSILEGCNQVTNLYKYRFLQGLCTNFILWLSILSSAGLWVLPISAFTTFVCACLFLWFRYRNFLKSVLSPRKAGPRIRWSKEILPMQWRLALSAISGYFAFSLFTPILFKYDGSVIAGRMGMTVSIIGFITALPGAWLIPKVPQFGMLVAKKDYSGLDRMFFRINKIFTILLIMSASLLWCLLYLLNIMKVPIASRLIPPLPAAIFLLGQVMIMITLPMSAYLRAHKKEPLFFPAIIMGALVGLSTVILGRLYSVMGVAVGYFLSASLAVPLVVLVWYKCRTEWHKDGV